MSAFDPLLTLGGIFGLGDGPHPHYTGAAPQLHWPIATEPFRFVNGSGVLFRFELADILDVTASRVEEIQPVTVHFMPPDNTIPQPVHIRNDSVRFRPIPDISGLALLSNRCGIGQLAA